MFPVPSSPPQLPRHMVAAARTRAPPRNSANEELGPEKSANWLWVNSCNQTLAPHSALKFQHIQELGNMRQLSWLNADCRVLIPRFPPASLPSPASSRYAVLASVQETFVNRRPAISSRLLRQSAARETSSSPPPVSVSPKKSPTMPAVCPQDTSEI